MTPAISPFQALKNAGFTGNAETAAAFDQAGFNDGPVAWATAVRKATPALFFNAMTASDTECKEWLRKHEAEETRRRYDRTNAAFYAQHGIR